jgi:calcyclin binding protein
MSESLEEIQLDLEELKSLLAQAKRKKVRTFLNNQIAILENKTQSSHAQKNSSSSSTLIATTNSTSATTNTGTSTTGDVTKFTPITTYSFDQDEHKVNVYIHLRGISPEKTTVDLQCTEQSFDLKLFHVTTWDESNQRQVLRNYRLNIMKTDGPIDKLKSSVKVKKDCVILTLIKTNDRHWLQLPYKKMVGEDFDPERHDPAKGLIGMMKQLYEEGDEEMKRTIAKTWAQTERQNKYAYPSKKAMMRN